MGFNTRRNFLKTIGWGALGFSPPGFPKSSITWGRIRMLWKISSKIPGFRMKSRFFARGLKPAWPKLGIQRLKLFATGKTRTKSPDSCRNREKNEGKGEPSCMKRFLSCFVLPAIDLIVLDMILKRNTTASRNFRDES
jgi:hypothetical protein